MFHTILPLFALACISLPSVNAFDCSAPELKPFNFESIKGVHTAELVKNTPPSERHLTWNFGVCVNTDGVANCPKNSDICGITELKFSDSKQPIISEIISFNTGLSKSYKVESPTSKDKKSGGGVTITYKGASWGDVLVDADVKFICPDSSVNDKDLDYFRVDKWDGEKLKVSVLTKAACTSSQDDSNKPSKKKPSSGDNNTDDNGESWGWFTWIFIFMVLFLSIYIIGGAWFQYNKGNAIDFSSALKEVLENFVDLLKGLPNFVKEIIEKVTGNSNRGEYSAV